MTLEEYLDQILKDSHPDRGRDDSAITQYFRSNSHKMAKIIRHLWEANEYANKEGERKRRMEDPITYGYHLIHSKASKARDKVLKELEA